MTGPAPRPGRAAPPLRLVLALGFGALGFGATLALALLIGREATRRLESEVGGQLAEIAGQMARGLDQGMFERWRDIQIAAASESLRDPAVSPAAKRAVMERLQKTYPAYSIIGLIEPDGRVAVTSNGLLEGANVAGRDYFLGARAGPFVGDVHAAQLLQKYLAPDAREPLRLLDVAAPVTGPDGRFLGVLAAHLDWTWARDMARTLEGSLTSHREGAEILILSRDGTVLLGPSALQGSTLQASTLRGNVPGAAPADGRALDAAGTSRLGPWPDGGADYLSAAAPTGGYRDYPGLGWRVVVRQKADRSLASVAALRWDILTAGGTVALAAAFLAWLLAGLVAQPLRELALAAGALGRDEPLPPLPRSIVREGEMVAAALTEAASELARREEAHRLLIDELNHRVKNTLATVQSMAAQSLKNLGDGAAAGRDAFEARLLALSHAHDVLTHESWSSADMRGIVDQALRPFVSADSSRITLEGPDLRLSPEVALALTMILHELCTNAVKHGALSAPGGRAALTWAPETGPGGAHLRLTWREHGGPTVSPPSRRGFGTRLLERGIDGREAVALTYEPGGLVYVAAAPLPDSGRAEVVAKPFPRGQAVAAGA